MKRKIIYTDEPIKSREIKDFLPSPEYLVRKEEKQRVTIEFTKSSLNLFKKFAQEHNASYQVMIRRLVDFYANSRYKKSKPFKFAST